MIQVMNRAYFINENLIKDIFEFKNRYFIKDKVGNRYEISKEDYIKLGGKASE